jgi:hypothetical protein
LFLGDAFGSACRWARIEKPMMGRLTTLLVFLVLVSTLHAQTWRGVISGTLTDAAGAAVSSARISITESSTQRSRSAVTNDQGVFTFSSLAPAEYVIAVERPGIQSLEQKVTLLVNQDVRVDLKLIGQQSERIEVTAASELLKIESPAESTVVDSAAVRLLPLDGRNFYDLSLLAPGTVPAAQGSAGSVRGDFAINVNGAREDSNNFLLDGIYNGDPKLNGAGVTPPVDAIREFEVLTSTYDASFGRNAGGQINVVFRSGSNGVHGTVWEFFRNAALDSHNHFAPAGEREPRHQQNQFGFSLGGPVRRNRTFFFGDYEGRRTNEGITQITNVPTLLERSGDFSQSAMAPIDLFTRQPFPGSRIPAQRLHPVGQGIVNLYPLPNRNVPGQNYVSSPVRRDRTNHFDGRLDHHFSPSSDFALRYSCADRNLFEPFSGSSFSRVPGFGTDIPRRAQNVMASETHAFTPAFLNEFRVGFNRVAMGAFHQNQGRNLNREVGLPSIWLNSRDEGLSFISLPGYSPLGDEYNNPQHGVTNTYQIVDQANVTAGRHLVKFGGEFRRLQQNAYRDVQGRGFLTFFGISGNPVGDLLQGFPTVTGGARIDNHQNLRSSSYALFLHDTYRLSQSFVVSAGLRYEYTSPGVDIRDRANLYDAATGMLAPVGKGDMPRGGHLPDRNNFAPRVGITWSPGRQGLVLRAAYGVYYDQSALAPSEGLYFSPPYYDMRLYQTLAQFPLLLHDPFPSNYPFPIPSSALAIQRDLRTPYVQHWNTNIQKELGKNRVLEIGYVASKGTKLISPRDINQPAPSPGESYMRPNPRFDDIAILESRGSSVFHSLQAKYHQRLTAGLAVLAAYTFGKSIDDGSGFFSSTGDPNFPQDSYNIRAERGLSNFDIRHRATISYSYNLPLGFETHGFLAFQSGRPFTVALLPDLDNSNTGRSVLGFGANDRPNLIGDAKLEDGTEQRWFNTAAFAIPARGTFGNAGRNIVQGPGFATANLSLLKNLRLSEVTTLQLRAEAFNLFNRTNYNLPDNYVSSPSFGAILSAGSPRRFQLGVKLLF